MIISKKAIPRRTVLRGMGSMLALPLLDSMVPALSALQTSAARPTNRFGVMYVPNGMIMKNYLPLTEGAAYELTPTLSALAPFRERVLVLSGLECVPTPGRPGGAHAKASTRFLTDAGGQMGGHGGEQVASVVGGGHGLQAVGGARHVHGEAHPAAPLPRETEQPVVRAHQDALVGGLERHCASLGAHLRVHHGHVHPGGHVGQRVAQDDGPVANVISA